MPDELIFAPRLMLPPRDALFILALDLWVISLYFLELTRQRIERYERLLRCRAARKTPRP